VDVANVAGDDVAKYKLFPTLRNVQMSDVKEESVRASWGRVELETVRDHCGVVVPTPTNLLDVTTNAFVATVSDELAVIVEKSPVTENKSVVEATPLTLKFVVVAFVPVALVKVNAWSVEEPLARIFVLCKLVVVANVDQTDVPIPVPTKIVFAAGVDAVIPNLTSSASIESLAFEC